ncbi:hypothetical protein BLNAU_13940 [Blattamonas nauphoetae]|uniref:Uncharacterized protein n=1 Tax=Blattamonas nauphoetae TaxID=2049346 RepID=A0ABQ9XF45_9EUKA|nr:hypothetical protein BLNAU_13940 [Blattamonas nauphoetae]
MTAKLHFQMQFAAQYTIEHAQSIEWHTISIQDLNSDQRVTLSEIDESMSLGDLRQTQNTPDGRYLSSLLVIMTFSSTVLEDSQFQHSQQISDFEDVTCDEYLKKDLPTIARNVLVAIDSSIGPLSQCEFPNYNKRPDEVMPLDTSKFMMKTVGSYWGTENLEHPLKDILFRPSWYSLLSHILFNSQKYERKPDDQKTRPMTHVVIGSSGVGKSALRFPAITLALSLGAKEVCSAKADEYPLRFVRKTIEVTTQSTSLTQPDPHPTPLPTADSPAKKPTMRVAHVNMPPRDAPITPTTYKYEVFISKTKAEIVYDDNFFKTEYFIRQEMDPNNPGEVIYTQPNEENWIKLGEVEVPSIHHFPHFLRLFVDRRDQVRNPLEDKTWHIIDDLELVPEHFKPSQHYILLTAPNQTHLKHIVEAKKPLKIPLVMYVSPRYTVAEEVNMLNAIPFKFEPYYESYVAGHKKIVKTLGFTPRNMQDYVQYGRELESLKKLAKKVKVSGDIFGQSISHNLIVLDSPQADPHNFTTAYASPRAEELVAEKWRKHLKAQCVHFVDGTGVINTTDEVKKFMIHALFKRLTNSAVRQGAHFSKMKIRGQPVVCEDGKPFSFPPTPTRSGVDSSGTCDTLHAFLPNMAEFQCSEENRFDDDKWGRFFVNAMEDEPIMGGPVEEKKGKFVFKKTDTPNPIEVEVGGITPIDSVTPSDEQTMDQHEQPTAQDHRHNPFHFFTFHLVPQSLYNAGFESILLFFRVDSTNKIDSLGVHFLKSSIGDGEEIDEVGANAMMAWLALLMDLYELRADQIFPHFVFVVSERVFDRFTPNTLFVTDFIPEDNIVIAALTSPTGNLNDLTIEAEDTLLLDTGQRLQPNNDPMCLRCGFCGEVIGGEFFHHECINTKNGRSNLNFQRQLLDPTTRHSLFKSEPQWKKKIAKSACNIVSEDDPTFFYTQKTLAEREADRQSGSSDRHADTHPVGLQVKYPFPTMARPNARMSGNHVTFDVVRVTMVSPVEAQRLGRRLLTDSFGNTEHATLQSISVTVSLPQPLPPPCHLYRTPFCPPPRRRFEDHIGFPQRKKIGIDPEGHIAEVDVVIDDWSDGEISTDYDEDDQDSSEGEESTSDDWRRELEQADEQQTWRDPNQTEPTTSDMADQLDTWSERIWIKMETDGNTCSARATSLSPYTSLEFEEPSPFLVNCDDCLGQMMLPFEQVGELRERIRRSFPAIHPSLLSPHPHTEKSRPQLMMELCLLVIQQELELFWQMLSLPNMTEPDFDSSFGFSFCGLQMILQKFRMFIKFSVNFQRDLRLFAKQLLSKTSAVQARIATITRGLVSSTHIDILNWCHVTIWRDTHPKREDSPSESRIIQMEDELKALDQSVMKPMYDSPSIPKDAGDQTTPNDSKMSPELLVQREILLKQRESLLHRAWMLFDFFGSLAMTLPASTLTPHTIASAYQPMSTVWKDRKETDVLKSMRYVSAIIGVVEQNYFQTLVQSRPINYDTLEIERVKCLETFLKLREYLTPTLTLELNYLRGLGQKIIERKENSRIHKTSVQNSLVTIEKVTVRFDTAGN